MTFYKILAEGKNGEYDITVYEKHEKFATNPTYEIVVSRNGIAHLAFPTAKTTWKKKFRQFTE